MKGKRARLVYGCARTARGHCSHRSINATSWSSVIWSRLVASLRFGASTADGLLPRKKPSKKLAAGSHRISRIMRVIRIVIIRHPREGPTSRSATSCVGLDVVMGSGVSDCPIKNARREIRSATEQVHATKTDVTNTSAALAGSEKAKTDARNSSVVNAKRWTGSAPFIFGFSLEGSRTQSRARETGRN